MSMHVQDSFKRVRSVCVALIVLVFATPALAGDNLYLRTQTSLYAFGAPTTH